MQTKIIFRESRDLGEILNTTFSFIKQNFGKLLKSVLFISGPAILLGASLFGVAQSNVFKIPQSGGSANPVSMFAETMFAYIFIFLGSFLVSLVVYEYIRIYIEREETGNITVSDVWKAVKEDFWKLFGTIFGISVLTIAIITILIGIGAALVYSMDSRGTGIAAAVILGIFAFLFLIYIGISLSLIYCVKIYENQGFFSTVSRCFSLVRGNWWRTFLVIFVLTLIQNMLSFIFVIPSYAAIFITAFNSAKSGAPDLSDLSLVFAVSMSLILLGYFILSTILLIGINLHYFSLVEKKEASGLLEKISHLDFSSQPKHAEEY